MNLNSKKQTTLDSKCTICHTVFNPDEIENDVPERIENKNVYCGLFSIGFNEHYRAAENNLRLAYGMIINSYEDNDSDKVIYKDKEYIIERKYVRGDGYTELYLRE